MLATMHRIMRSSVLLVALVLVGSGKGVLGQTDGVTETSSVSDSGEEGSGSSTGSASTLISSSPRVANDAETVTPLPDSGTESASEAVQLNKTPTPSPPGVIHGEKEHPTEAERRIDGGDNHTNESSTTIPSTTAESVADPKPCSCTCPPPPPSPACKILTTIATTISDVASTEKNEAAKISTESFKEDQSSGKGSSFLVKAIVALGVMAAIFGILIIVNLCRRHRGDISAKLREWKDTARGKGHLVGFCSKCSCYGKSTRSTPILVYKRGKYGEEDSDLDILTESMYI